ncbi:MAG TPA: hypothetical protein ENK91_05545 [Bacteroidetes bacterium]|nr:hypothetical protein [Bacteroidota bacterium]
MKSSVFYFFLLLFFASCSPVLFETIDFVKDNTLEFIPIELRGKYISSDGDYLTLSDRILDMGYDSINGKRQMDTLKRGSFEIAKFEDYYLLCKKDDGFWSIVPLLLNRNKLNVYYIDEDEYAENNLKDIKDENKKKEIFFSRLNKITPVKKIYKESGKIDYYLINPTKKQFKKLLYKGFFSKIDELTRIES